VEHGLVQIIAHLVDEAIEYGGVEHVHDLVRVMERWRRRRRQQQLQHGVLRFTSARSRPFFSARDSASAQLSMAAAIMKLPQLQMGEENKLI
jgi:hypothetical protein